MEVTINVNGKDTKITLTPDQVGQVKKATTNYTDITSVEKAFEFEGINYNEWCNRYKDLPTDVRAYMKLCIIVKAINGGIVMDYKNTREYKYYPWFNAVGSGAGFSYYVYYYGNSGSAVGSRLCFIDSERATFAGKQFIEIYNEYIN